jgi:hypothetical protein
MKRAQQWVRVLIIVALAVSWGLQLRIIHTQMRTIELADKTIKMQGAAIEHWKMRAMACEDIVQTDDH